jgi:diaminopimelate decarboxylase
VSPLAERDGALAIEGVPLESIAHRFGTPCYVYSRAALESAYRAFDRAFAGVRHRICYAVKANANLAVLGVFARLGSGFDIVSGGELDRVLTAGGDPGKTVFSGVGKSDAEIVQALEASIACFNVESASELRHLAAAASRLRRRAPVSIRVNPDVDPRTHPYISTGLRQSKFGVPFDAARTLYREAARMPDLDLMGIDMHIGSQITELSPYIDAARKVLALVDELAGDGIRLRHVDVGGGIGIRYQDETTLDLREYAAALSSLLAGRPLELVLEPGRYLVGNAGVLLTRVQYLKTSDDRNFAIVDAAMNDLLRPALYDAWHDVRPVRPRDSATLTWQIVGPVCESADFIATDRDLALAEGDLLAVCSAGAYAMAMASNYNSRPRAAELMVDGSVAHLVRARERSADLYAHESLLP